MLVHFVGDLHQPLHVGAIHLDENGHVIDPDVPASQDRHLIETREQTAGGNFIYYGTKDLHTFWDHVPGSWGMHAGHEDLT